MSIRLRLVLCYGELFAVILLLIMVLSYTIHARGEYDDLDRTLLVSVGHAAAEATGGDGRPHLVQGRNGLDSTKALFKAPIQIRILQGGHLFEAVEGDFLCVDSSVLDRFDEERGPLRAAAQHVQFALLQTFAQPRKDLQ